MNSKQQLVDLYRRYITEYLDDRYIEEQEKRNKEITSMAPLVDDYSTPTAKLVNDYVTELMADASRQAYGEARDKAIKLMIKDMSGVVDELFTDNEAEQIVEFCNSSVGLRLLRNLDVLRDSFAVGNNLLLANIVKSWSDPKLIAKINDFVESFDTDDESDETDTEDGEE